MGFLVCFMLVLGYAMVKERSHRRKQLRKLQRSGTRTSAAAPASPSFVEASPSSAVRVDAVRRTMHERFGDGVFEVGVDIAPGTYFAPGHPSRPTTWQRLSDFTGAGVISTGSTHGPCIVTILRSDRGFASQDSGGWTSID